MHNDYIPPDTEFIKPNGFSAQDYLDNYTTSPLKAFPSSSFRTPTRSSKHPNSQNLSESVITSLRVQSTSKKILKDVLEQEWSSSSYSKEKRMKILKKNIRSSSLAKKPGPMSEVLAENQITDFYLGVDPFHKYRKEFQDHYQSSKNCEFVGLEQLSPDLQVLKYLEYALTPCKDLKYGALVMIRKIMSESPDKMIVGYVLEQLLPVFDNWQEEDDEYLEALLFIVSSVGFQDAVEKYMNCFLSILDHDESTMHESLHESAFACLFRLGVEGIGYLIDQCSRSGQYLKDYILKRLLATDLIQQCIIIPALVQDFIREPQQLSVVCLSALDRLYISIANPQIFEMLATKLQTHPNKLQLACILSHVECKGHRTLLKLLQSGSSEVKIACIQSLTAKQPTAPQKIQLKIVRNLIDNCEELPPGSFWKYQGPLVSTCEDANSSSILELNTRDLLAALQRWRRHQSEVFSLLPPSMPISQSGSMSQTSEASDDLLKSLIRQTKSADKEVRKAAAYALGTCPQSESHIIMPALLKSLYDQDASVRANAAWAIGNLQVSSERLTSELVHLLKDNFLQVRNAACVALATAGLMSVELILPILVKHLREGSISRNIISETIVKLGIQGEKKLIEILLKEPIGNIVIRVGIIRALGSANVNSNHIDFVIETLFKLCGENAPAIRKESLLSLRSIERKACQKLAYLNPQTMLPLFMKLLKDPCKDIRAFCIQCIIDVGPQGELVLIEAFTKDSNFIIRAQAAKGLGLLGPSHFKILILGLHDSHSYVRKSALNAIMINFSVEMIKSEFIRNQQQMQSLKCAIKEVLNLPYHMSASFISFLKKLLLELKNEEDDLLISEEF